jgi:adenosylcobinamide kinase/adenosylcobinamide-phosphate guanylyltransferase
VSGHLLLVTGGARSGKSRYAFDRAATSAERVLYIATGVSTDDEMAARIARHRAERPAAWTTLEVSHGIAPAIRGALADHRCLLVEDLGSLVTNLIVELSANEAEIQVELDGLLALRQEQAIELIIVSPEVGLGLVPPTPLGRLFRDALGRVNQIVAAAADEVVLVVAGLPLHLKGR